MSAELDEFDNRIYEEAFEFLDTYDPGLAATVKKAVAANVSPDALRKRWLRSAGQHRIEMAQRIENAAKYLHSLKVTA